MLGIIIFLLFMVCLSYSLCEYMHPHIGSDRKQIPSKIIQKKMELIPMFTQNPEMAISYANQYLSPIYIIHVQDYSEGIVVSESEFKSFMVEELVDIEIITEYHLHRKLFEESTVDETPYLRIIRR